MDMIFDNHRRELRRSGTRRRLAKAVRVLTLPPLAALALVLAVDAAVPGFFSGWAEPAVCIFCLTVLPISAYPLQRFFPAYRGRGRAGQRELAILMANVGYVLGAAAVHLLGAGAGVKLMMLTYLFSGGLILLFNKGLCIRASGHACGVAGPVALLVLCAGGWAWAGLAVLAAVYWASLAMDRHKPAELVWGTALPLAAMAMAELIAAYFR